MMGEGRRKVYAMLMNEKDIHTSFFFTYINQTTHT